MERAPRGALSVRLKGGSGSGDPEGQAEVLTVEL